MTNTAIHKIWLASQIWLAANFRVARATVLEFCFARINFLDRQWEIMTTFILFELNAVNTADFIQLEAETSYKSS